MEERDIKEEFLAAFDAYADAIFRFCFVKTSDRELAEDLTQETFTRLWQAMREGRELSEMRGFLYAIARNLVIDWYRKKKPVSLERLNEEGFDPADRNVDIETDVDRKEVLRTILKLPDEDREILLLRFAEGLSPKEAAEALGISANLASVRSHRALEKLKHLLKYE